MQGYVSGGKKLPHRNSLHPRRDALCSLRSPSPTSNMRKYNSDAPGIKFRGRPKKESSDKRDRKVSVNFTEDEEREVKAKASAAGISIAELLRISAFRLSIVERLTDFEREAIRELMYQGKNLNDQVRACQANAWPSTKRKAEACLDGILATLGKLKTSNSSLL